MKKAISDKNVGEDNPRWGNNKRSPEQIKQSKEENTHIGNRLRERHMKNYMALKYQKKIKDLFLKK